ncbi:hypothetical protein M0P65_07100 [Candidatus Gracilibacteria bacterium]|jgi:hypothetical protein|nr:hypothetical protein [Candidatus Gracilibacteria bacterium]
MENIITFEGHKRKWEYSICPCLDCPIYPLRKEWEDSDDVRENKCYTSRCSYDREKAREIANEIYFIMHNYHCEECNKWFSKDDFFEKYCPECGIDMSF